MKRGNRGAKGHKRRMKKGPGSNQICGIKRIKEQQQHQRRGWPSGQTTIKERKRMGTALSWANTVDGMVE
jgi:hypothetical protein